MHIIGVDISKNELVTASMTKRGIVTGRSVVKNDVPSIEAWLDTLLPFRILIGSEATAEFHVPLAKACLNRGITFKLLNPIVTKQFTRATVRKRKSDMGDAEVIARCLLNGEGYAVTEESLDPAKRLLRTAEKLRGVERSLLRMAEQLGEYVSGADPVPICVLAKEARKAALAMQKQGVYASDRKLSRLLTSIPGVGEILAATIAAEVGDVRRFTDGKALVAYAGLDPRVRQSGSTLAKNTRLTKRGSPFLRRAFYYAAMIAERHDPELKAYYEKKRAEGKRYTEATVANARHVAHRAYAVLKRGTPFVPCLLSTETT